MGWPIIALVLALASSYVCATSVNDIADREIDRINHPRDEGRPLVTGTAEVRDLRLVFIAAGLLTLGIPLTVGPLPFGIMALSVVIGVLYSLPPVELSHRTFLAPLTLAVAYVGVPYWAGVVAVGENLGLSDVLPMAALYLFFAGRIVLKDFRDREGDAAYGKPTFLLRHGKRATCLLSLGAVCAGDVLLVVALADRAWLAGLLQIYVAGVAFMLFRLYRAEGRREEQISIGVGARMGNGLLTTLLGTLVLANAGAETGVQLTFALALAAVYAVLFASFLRHPDAAAIGYKG
jgi:4-hydroxybenzoate polyprenyltransferase